MSEPEQGQVEDSTPNDDMDGLAPHQYQSLYEEEDIPLLDLRANLHRFVPSIALFFLFFLVITGFLVRIPRELRYTTVLKSATPETIYRFPDPVYLEETMVRPGQQVEEGAPLIRLSSPEIATLIAAYRRAERDLDLFLREKVHDYEIRQDLLHLDIRDLETAIERLELQRAQDRLASDERLRKLQDQSRLAQSRAEARAQLDKDALIAKEDYLDAATRVRTTAADLARAKLESQRDWHLQGLDLRALQVRLDRSRAELDLLCQDREIKRRELTQTLENAEENLHLHYGPTRIADGTLVLLAPQASTVSFVFDGQREVGEGLIALKLLKNSADLYAYAKIPPHDIGHVRPGMNLIVKVDTFPHYRWGFVKGTIQHLSLAPDETGAFPFEVRLTDRGKLDELLKVGMTGELVIQVDNRHFWGLVFEGLHQESDRLLR